MQKFQDLLTQAAQLKQQQLKQERKNFQALPEYLKSGLNYAKKYIQLRKQHYLVQKYVSQKLKKQGNDHYLLQNYGQALSKYQQALSVFRFIHATKYENLKDEDIIYENYKPQQGYKQEHNNHLVALYLNICSALTKMNKKDEAIHSSQQALKLNQNNAKIFYKKAQAYLQYINRESSDIKLGFYYLNKAYELSKDQSILTQMHKIKKQLDEQRQKQKKWFKFMFDKTKQEKNQNKQKSNQNKEIKSQKKLQDQKKLEENAKPIQNNPQSNTRKFQSNEEKDRNAKQYSLNDTYTKINKDSRLKQQFAKFRSQTQNQQDKNITQIQKLQKTKLSLKPYLIIPRNDRWLIKYQQDFIHKHGSKVYSILQLYNYSQYLVQFKSLLAKCLQLKQAKVTPQRDENKILQQKISTYQRFIQWLKKHPVQKYKRYIQRYDLQTQWIESNRGKPLDQVYPKQPVTQKIKKPANIKNGQERLNQFLQAVRQTNKIPSRPQLPKQKQIPRKPKNKQDQFEEQMFQKQQEIKKFANKKNKEKKNQSKIYNTHGFKQQWQSNEEDKRSSSTADQVPPHLQAFLQNYQDFPMYQQKLQQIKKEKSNLTQPKNSPQNQQFSRNMQQDLQNVKQNPFGFLKTFLVILAISLIAKFIF